MGRERLDAVKLREIEIQRRFKLIRNGGKLLGLAALRLMWGASANAQANMASGSHTNDAMAAKTTTLETGTFRTKVHGTSGRATTPIR